MDLDLYQACGTLHDSFWTSLLFLTDSEILDTESEENKVRLQSNGNWCIKAHTVDGKLEWIGSYPTKEAALSVYDIVNGSSCLRLKDVPPLSHTSFSSIRLVQNFTVFACYMVSDR